MVDNAANGALTLWVGSSGTPDSTARALAPAGLLRGPLQRCQHLVRGSEGQLSILRPEYQRVETSRSLSGRSGGAGIEHISC